MVSINGRMVVHMLLINSFSVACLINLCYFKQSALQMNSPLLIAHAFGISCKTQLKFLLYKTSQNIPEDFHFIIMKERSNSCVLNISYHDLICLNDITSFLLTRSYY
jgi:hypothetical protein